MIVDFGIKLSKISPRPSFAKRGNSSLCEREVRRDFIIDIVIIMRLLI
jgi:hypothetical protein